MSPNRELIAAKRFLQLAWSGSGPSPRVINVDGHPAYPTAIAELKQSGELSQRCRCRTSPSLNKVIEPDHRFIKKMVTAGLGFRSAEGAMQNDRGLRGDARNPKRPGPLGRKGRSCRSASIHPHHLWPRRASSSHVRRRRPSVAFRSDYLQHNHVLLFAAGKVGQRKARTRVRCRERLGGLPKYYSYVV
jgi:hypothetical protein